jgi:hypothetical protein
MGRRSEPRTLISYPVVIHGFDLHGTPFSVPAETFDISLSGASVTGLNDLTKVGAKIELEYEAQKAWYRVEWVGVRGAPNAGRVGVHCLGLSKYIWGVPPRERGTDTFEPPSAGSFPPQSASAAPTYSGPDSYIGQENRQFARHSYRIETQIRIDVSSIGIAGTITDVSLGGCYVEMLSPLPVDTAIHFSLNIGSSTLHVSGRVCSSQMRLGMGVSFTGMGPEDFENLRRFAPPAASDPCPAKAPIHHTSFFESGAPRKGAPQSTDRSSVIPEFRYPDLPTAAEALASVVRLLVRKQILTREELAEELEKSTIVK